MMIVSGILATAALFSSAYANVLRRQGAPPSGTNGTKASRFLNAESSRFAVNGSAIPDVDFDIGESYAGLLPISAAANESRQLYFWFFPSTAESGSEDITIWLNGGPGCSSLIGLVTENGPFLWQPGTYKPVRNPYAWNNLTNVLYVEQPVGTGFTQGTPNITNESELAQQFVGFFDQFVKTFKLEGSPTYLTGESYAGYYVPYIANELISTNDSNRPLKGISLINPIIASGVLQQQAILYPFIDYWQNLLYLNQTFLGNISQGHEYCGYKAYLDKYLQFPPPNGKFPDLPSLTGTEDPCNLRQRFRTAARIVNPCFDNYFITNQCPTLYEVINAAPDGETEPNDPKSYFRREDVQRAINAPIGVNWTRCVSSYINVFGGPNNNESLDDTSLGPARDNVLARIIEHTNNVQIGSGNLDTVLPTNGTLLALQNVTWNGQQGLQEHPSNDFIVPQLPGGDGGSGVLGQWGTERGLTFYTVQKAGHELPQYAPGAAFRALEVLLGRVNGFGDLSGFTTAQQSKTEL